MLTNHNNHLQASACSWWC